mmetsp:Transcript_20083/g.29530  ORF Transcript_20083/g.29530 Transcript_20083/m.29530 type:complete len:533 (-) Transcript_20083:152-1750(-)|eukprot:CAMPEP_0195520620 /NCGR_PEP_ID=MMETSP0794_2-20130614/17291_1 /TAXON_ID=515487 /ORGANISM="Stephanopyxis turris, Strain CCMP 815" /LENGTH=532 /DNA_ID=CAMNT_0040650017 /DNA_START=40 /DNA_END=1638 /DNA_ORIENTATION=-
MSCLVVGAQRHVSNSVRALFASSMNGAFNSARRSSSSGQMIACDPSNLPLPPRFLRDMDESNFCPNTHQRTNVKFDIVTGKPQSSVLEKTTVCSKINTAYYTSSDNDTKGRLVVEWKDGLVSEYPMKWIEEEVSRWHGLPTENSSATTKAHHSNHNNPSLIPYIGNRTLWKDLNEADLRQPYKSHPKNTTLPGMSLSFSDVLHSADGMHRALTILHRYGILLVTDAPILDEMSHAVSSIAAFASAISGGSVKQPTSSLLPHYRNNNNSKQQHHLTVLPNGTDGPQRTLYGTVWSLESSFQTEQGASMADSAYGHDGLPLHTDMAYMVDPPGLQIFAVRNSASQGGESVFADGFRIAHDLKMLHPDAFKTLSTVKRRYRCIDEETGWHLEAVGCAIEVNHYDNDACVITKIRHNDLDRLADLPPPSLSTEKEQHEFYQDLQYAHQKWDEMLAKDDYRLVVPLKPGDIVAVANQRVMHGRCSFVDESAITTTTTTTGKDQQQMPQRRGRAVMGCYVSQCELNSRFRREGFFLHD